MGRRQRMTGAVTFALVLLVAGGWWLARTPVPGFDRALARLVVRAPDAFEPALRLVMQMGSFGAVPLAALLVGLHLRRWGPPLRVLVSGGLAYLACQTVKDLVARPRPTAAVLGVEPRGYASGWSYPSGHAAVAFAIAVAVASCIGDRRWRAVAGGAALLTALARVYLGVHFPLDVAGGALLGAAVAGLVALPGTTGRSGPAVGPAAATERGA